MVDIERVRRLVRDRPDLEPAFAARQNRLVRAVDEINVPFGYGGMSVGPPIDVDRAREKLRRMAVVDANDDILDEYLKLRFGLDAL